MIGTHDLARFLLSVPDRGIDYGVENLVRVAEYLGWAVVFHDLDYREYERRFS